MDRREFLGALAAAGLIPKTWADDQEPTVETDDDYWASDYEYGDDLDDFEEASLPEPPPREPPPPPEPSEGPDALILDGVELRWRSFSWHRDMQEFGGFGGDVVFIPGGLTIEIETADEAVRDMHNREVTVAYRESGMLYRCGSGFALVPKGVRDFTGEVLYTLTLSVYRL